MQFVQTACQFCTREHDIGRDGPDNGGANDTRLNVVNEEVSSDCQKKSSLSDRLVIGVLLWSLTFWAVLFLLLRNYLGYSLGCIWYVQYSKAAQILRCSVSRWRKNLQIGQSCAWLNFCLYGLVIQFLRKIKFNGGPVCTLLLSLDRRFLQKMKTSVNEEFNIQQIDVFIFCKKRLSKDNKRVQTGQRVNFCKICKIQVVHLLSVY